MTHAEPFLEAVVEGEVLILTILRRQIEGEESASTLKEEMLDAVQKHGRSLVVLDMRNTRYVSSIAFWPLLTLRKQLNEKGGRLVICGLTGTVEEVFTSTKMVSSNGSTKAPFEMASDRAAAVTRLVGAN